MKKSDRGEGRRWRGERRRWREECRVCREERGEGGGRRVEGGERAEGGGRRAYADVCCCIVVSLHITWSFSFIHIQSPCGQMMGGGGWWWMVMVDGGGWWWMVDGGCFHTIHKIIALRRSITPHNLRPREFMEIKGNGLYNE
jgi:hypothetical protein